MNHGDNMNYLQPDMSPHMFREFVRYIPVLKVVSAEKILRVLTDPITAVSHFECLLGHREHIFPRHFIRDLMIFGNIDILNAYVRIVSEHRQCIDNPAIHIWDDHTVYRDCTDSAPPAPE